MSQMTYYIWIRHNDILTMSVAKEEKTKGNYRVEEQNIEHHRDIRDFNLKGSRGTV